MYRCWQLCASTFLGIFLYAPFSFSANVVLPNTPFGSSFYILPGLYGVLGDHFFLNGIFNSPNGNISGGNPAVTISGAGTFIISNTGMVNQSIGGPSGVSTLRAIILGRAGGTIANFGSINGISNSTVIDTFGMFSSSTAPGLTAKSAYALNYGTITMEGASTDGMHAAGTTAVRSYAANYGVINASDRVTGVSNWVEGMSASGNGAIINETTGIITARSKAGSRGSAGVFGGFDRPGFTGANSFTVDDPQVINKGTLTSFDDSHGFYFWGNFKTFERNDGVVNVQGRGHGVYFDNADNVLTGAGSGFINALTGTINTTNSNSYGIYLRLVNNIYAENHGFIQTLGSRAHGIVAYAPASYATNSLSGTISIFGDSTAGIFYNSSALNNPNFQWNLGNIYVNGSNSFGIATPQNFFRNDGNIIVSGSNSFGMLAGGSYNITPDGTIPNNTYLGGLTQLSAGQGASQLALNRGIINAVSATTVGLAAQGINSFVVNDGIVNVSGSAIGMLARSNANADNFGDINVDADSTGMAINAGSVGLNAGRINFIAQNGFLLGNINNSGTLDYQAGIGNANYSINGTLTNSGLMSIGGIPGNTVTITGDYIGQNGFLGLNTILAGDNSPSNKLIINNGSITGLTGLIINNTIGLGARKLLVMVF